MGCVQTKNKGLEHGREVPKNRQEPEPEPIKESMKEPSKELVKDDMCQANQSQAAKTAEPRMVADPESEPMLDVED